MVQRTQPCGDKVGAERFQFTHLLSVIDKRINSSPAIRVTRVIVSREWQMQKRDETVILCVRDSGTHSYLHSLFFFFKSMSTRIRVRYFYRNKSFNSFVYFFIKWIRRKGWIFFVDLISWRERVWCFHHLARARSVSVGKGKWVENRAFIITLECRMVIKWIFSFWFQL